MTRAPLFLAACAALALGACAATAADEATAAAAAAGAADRDCFATANISSYSVVDDHHVKLRVGASREYVLTLDWNARDLDWTHSIAVTSSPSSFICTGNGIGVRVVGGDPPRNYLVNAITRAPAEPAAAQAS